MSEYRSNTDLAGVSRLLRAAKRVLVTTHAKPDGDAFGSVVAMTVGLRALGVSADTLLMGPVPALFKALRGYGVARLHSRDFVIPPETLVLVLDTGAWSQLSPLRDALSPRVADTLILDHHLSGDVPAATRYIDQSASATCEIVAQALTQLHEDRVREANEKGGRPPHHPFADPVVADSLFTGIASDTGWFRFSNTRPYTHELAAQLLRTGVDHAGLYQKLEQADRPEKLALLGRALASLRYAAEGSAVVMTLRAQDFQSTGASLEETERFVDIPQLVGAVRVVALLVEPPPSNGGTGQSERPLTRVSLRSKPGERAVDVNALAKQFGGGGHARAAGAKIEAPLFEVAPRIEAAIVAAMR